MEGTTPCCPGDTSEVIVNFIIVMVRATKSVNREIPVELEKKAVVWSLNDIA